MTYIIFTLLRLATKADLPTDIVLFVLFLIIVFIVKYNQNDDNDKPPKKIYIE